jgi:enoyl-CoA hydratase/carnithine racemase
MLELIDHAPDGIREIRLARPPVNALNIDLLRRLTAEFSRGAEARALLVSGAPGLFSAGLDVRSMLALDPDGVRDVFIEVWRVQRALAVSTVPVVFAITGHCPAGGTVLAIHADYRVMAQGDFRLGLNETQVGLLPGPPIDAAFRRLVGGHAAQLLTRGALVDPATALRVGLVDELCDVSQVVPRALAMAREFLALPREAMQRTRALVRRDLVDLFGAEDGGTREREFAEMGLAMWSSDATQARLKAMFARAG